MRPHGVLQDRAMSAGARLLETYELLDHVNGVPAAVWCRRGLTRQERQECYAMAREDKTPKFFRWTYGERLECFAMEREDKAAITRREEKFNEEAKRIEDTWRFLKGCSQMYLAKQQVDEEENRLKRLKRLEEEQELHDLKRLKRLTEMAEREDQRIREEKELDDRGCLTEADLEGMIE